MPARPDRYSDHTSVVLSHGGLTAVVLPDLGAKIISLVNERTGREYIWRDPHRALRSIQPGSSYADNDASGIDDCFPTIDPCRHPDPDRDLHLNGHGDLWWRPWTWRTLEDRAIFTANGDTLPYRFEKTLRIESEPTRLVLEYALAIDGDQPLRYQWAAHPLLRAEKGMRIGLPAGTRARTAFATGGRLAAGNTRWPWPSAIESRGKRRDISVVGGPHDGMNEKYWLPAPPHGCLLSYHNPDERIRIDYDSTALPWLAVCVNYGGWPATNPGHWVAIEPSTSPCDTLADSAKTGSAPQIQPGQTHRWWWSITVDPD